MVCSNTLETDTNIRTGWATVLNRNNAQPILDQRRHLSDTFQLNIDEMDSCVSTIRFSNFTSNRTVYYSNTDTNLLINSVIPPAHLFSNLYVKDNNNIYFKLTPYTTETDYQFKWFWRISNHRNPASKIVFVTLSNSSPSTRFVKSDDSNVKISGFSLNLMSLPTSRS